MCECGCVSNDEKYRLLGPDKTLYIITLSGHCTSCDAPPGVSIEQIGENDSFFWDYQNGDLGCKPLKFEKWSDSEGVAIVTAITHLTHHDCLKMIIPSETQIR